MKIQLEETKAIELSLSQCNDEVKDEFQLGVSSGFADELGKSFVVKFKIDYVSAQNYRLILKYEALFSTDQEIDEEFKNGLFPRINAPAIAYPFMRSFVSTITVNAGYESILLPTVNFSAMVRSEMEKESNPAE